MLKSIVSVPAAALALVIAARSEPAPASFVVVTVKVANAWFQAASVLAPITTEALNRSGGGFKLPVSILSGTPGTVRARGHIGAGEIGQRVHCQLPVRATAKVTAVDQDVGGRRQALTDLLKLFSVGRADRILRQEARAEMHLGLGAIADEVDRIDARSAGEDLRHLGHAVAGRIEYVYFDVGADAVEELLVVENAGGQEHDLLAGNRGIVRRQGIEQRHVPGSGLRFARRGSGCRVS